MAEIGSTVRSGARDWTNLKAAAFVVATVAIFGLIFTSGRFVGDLASPLQIMFLRYVGGFITVVAIAWRSGETWATVQSPYRFAQVMRALTGGLGGAAIIFGNTHIPLVDTNAISLLKPVFLVALGVIFLGDLLRPRHLIGITICLAGAVVVVGARGAFSTLEASYLLPAAVVFGGAMLLAAEGVYIKILADKDRPMVTIVHANFFGMLLLAIPAALTWQSTGWVNLALLGLGPLAIFGQYLNIRGYALAPVSILAPLTYSSLVFAALYGWLFFAELPTLGVVLGALLIAAGGIVLAMSRR